MVFAEKSRVKQACRVTTSQRDAYLQQFGSAAQCVEQAWSSGRDWLGLILMGWFDRYCITLKALPIFPVTSSTKPRDRPPPNANTLFSHPHWDATYWIFFSFKRLNFVLLQTLSVLTWVRVYLVLDTNGAVTELGPVSWEKTQLWRSESDSQTKDNHRDINPLESFTFLIEYKKTNDVKLLQSRRRRFASIFKQHIALRRVITVFKGLQGL